MIDQAKLIAVLQHDLRLCRRAARLDVKGKERKAQEYKTLLTHRMWAERVGSNQVELEAIVRSLEINRFVRDYHRWRRAVTR